MDIGNIKVLKVEGNNGKIIYQTDIDLTTFIFDKKGIKLFLEKFVIGSSEITTENSYLIRIKDGKKCSFHKWYKLYDSNYIWNGVEIHHKNGNIADNRGNNLKIMGKDEHSEFHIQRREKNRHNAGISTAYQTYKQKFLDNDPDATPQKINYFWSKFKEENNID